jgi:CubicO group peptidase (beta-lactamase class C family)
MARLIFSFNFLIFIAVNLFSQNSAPYFPPKTGTAWETLAPAELNFCPDRIDSLYNFLEERNTKSFILLKDGKIVLEKYFGTFAQDSFWYWASAGKSLTAFLVGQAQEEGLLDIADKTSDYLAPGWTSCPPDKEALITIRHQLTMTSGLDDAVPDDNCELPSCLIYKADAGTRWAYHNAPYRLIHDVIEEASSVSINYFTKTHVLDRTGMKGLWIDHIMYGRARDMARFGLLMQARGTWDGDTLLHDQQYYHDMIHPSQDLNKSYGYLWWLNGQPSFMVPGLQFVFPGKLIPNAPDDMYSALGKNDQKIHVVPSKGWVVVRQGNAAGYVGPGGNQVPIAFDNEMWSYLNQLVCVPSAVSEVVENQVKIFPNPASEGWQIESAEAIEQVEIFDLQGKMLRPAAGNNSAIFWLDATGLPEGVFAIKIFAGGKTVWAKVVKTKQ